MNPWNPITDALDLKRLGKLAEELGECQAAVARCIIQGLDESEPVTGKVNRLWLQEEIADVMANVHLVVERLNLDTEFMADRIDRKIERLREWHKIDVK